VEAEFTESISVESKRHLRF